IAASSLLSQCFPRQRALINIIQFTSACSVETAFVGQPGNGRITLIKTFSTFPAEV
ncbi:hypothetical protein BaRGS_00039923, partial [Batillaria attramentaria]